MNRRMLRVAAQAGDADPMLTTLDNGARVVVFRLPHLATAAVSVFVRSGSQHEAARLNVSARRTRLARMPAVRSER